MVVASLGGRLCGGGCEFVCVCVWVTDVNAASCLFGCCVFAAQCICVVRVLLQEREREAEREANWQTWAQTRRQATLSSTGPARRPRGGGLMADCSHCGPVCVGLCLASLCFSVVSVLVLLLVLVVVVVVVAKY